jgi:transposase
MARQGYSAEFRRKVLDRLANGHSVASVAHDLDLSDQTIYNWRRQDRIDRGLQPGRTTQENAELAAAKKRIAELEAELAVSRRSMELLKEQTGPKGGTRPSR